MLSGDDEEVGRLGSEALEPRLRASGGGMAAPRADARRLVRRPAGRHEQGLDRMLTAIRGQTVRGSYLLMPLMMTMYAELAAGAGMHDAALRQLDEAEASMEEQSQHIWRAELHRVRALALAQSGAGYSESSCTSPRAVRWHSSRMRCSASCASRWRASTGLATRRRRTWRRARCASAGGGALSRPPRCARPQGRARADRRLILDAPAVRPWPRRAPPAEPTTARP